MKKQSILRWEHEGKREDYYTAALILSDRRQLPEIEVKIEVPKAWIEPIRVSLTVVRRPGGLTSQR